MTKCPFCNKSQIHAVPKCACGYPVGGTPEECKTFLNTKLILANNDIDQSGRHLKIARYIILGIGVLAFLGMASNMGNPHMERVVALQAALGIAFVLLGFFFPRFPVAACTVALVLGLFIFPLSLLTILIIVFLGIGLYFALEAGRAAKKKASVEKLLCDIE